jgi:hypothetical protein
MGAIVQGSGVAEGPIRGTLVTHRNAVSADDSAWPAADSGVDCSGYKYAEVDIALGGTTPSWDVTPGFYNGTGAEYIAGVKRTISGTDNLRFAIEVNGHDDVYFYCDGKSGTSPTITIYVTPFN